MPVASKPKLPISGFGAGAAGGGASAATRGAGASGSVVEHPARIVVAARPIRTRFIMQLPCKSDLPMLWPDTPAKRHHQTTIDHVQPTNGPPPRRWSRRARHLLRVHCVHSSRLMT